ncbi:hypothetical protein ABT026_13535 [Streptomyces sp. NPDC002734]|uniref:hypothetical protein n=1 Tax=Streptomyces sp. NPDC002734 TaxID=3154426 RepID=UPI00332515A5
MKRNRALAAAVALGALLAACAAAPPDAQALLDRRARALLDGDRAAFTATGAPALWKPQHALPLAAWRYRVTGRQGEDGATVKAELRYRLERDARAATARRVLTLARDADGSWRVTADRPAPGEPEQLWDQGAALRTAVTARTLVVASGPADPGAWTGPGDAAARAVRAAWDTGVRPVIVVPDSTDAMARLLGAPTGTYRDTAAVTTPGEAPRVVVNPEAWQALGEEARQVVLTHETAHVALRARTTPRTPMWLSEGCADWTAYRTSRQDPARTAPALARAVRDGDVPRRLPADGDFAFGGDAGTVGRAYEGAWLACRLVADRWGDEAVRDLYEAAGTDGEEAALRRVLDVDRDGFTALWRDALRRDLGG